MQRIPEPELMIEPLQAKAYAGADFTEPHDFFVEQFRRTSQSAERDTLVLDLGCGPADITVRMAKAFGHFRFHGVDGSEAMLAEGRKRLQREKLQDRIQLFRGTIPDYVPPSGSYSLVISNSLLHHLHQPSVLWQFLKRIANTDTWVFIMDLCRPGCEEEARELVNTYSDSEPDILRRDFYNSLCAAFTGEEVKAQLEREGLSGLQLEQVTDRHLIIYGNIINALL